MIPANSPGQMDVAALLKPITENSPCGEYLLYEGTYDRIKEARREDDVSLERGVWKHNLKRADWPAVEGMCIRALEEYSKDLQIAAWLLEAWLHLYGFAGLREGLVLMDSLIRTFWDGLYPPMPDGDLEYRLGPVLWLNDRIPVAVKMVSLTQPDSSDIRAYCWADWEIASRAEQSAKLSGKADPPDERVTQARIQQSALLTPTDFLIAQVRTLDEALQACGQLNRTLDEACDGHQAPSLQQIAAVLEQIHGLLDSILNQRDVSPSRPPAESASGTSVLPSNVSDDRTTSSEGVVRTRAEAYRRLAEAADFLLRTEPHSPSGYLVRRAISWGSMSLEELLPQLVQNGAELKEIYRLLQIEKKP